MNISKLPRTAVATALLCVAMAIPAVGATIEAGEAFTSWIGKGEAHVAGERMLFNGVIDGVMFIRHYKGTLRGPIHAAKLHCPIMVNMNPKTNERTTSGFCVVNAHEGKDVAYAEFRCSGSSEDCEGDFSWIGGDGGFTGISGTTKIRSRMDFGARDPGTISGFAIWPNLTYELP